MCFVKGVAQSDKPTNNHLTLQFHSVVQRVLAAFSSLLYYICYIIKNGLCHNENCKDYMMKKVHM